MPETAAAGGPALRSLGLARRAGRVVVGTRAVLEAAGSGRLALVVLAGDASDNAVDRLARVRRSEGTRVLRLADKRSLGEALGRGPVAVAGVTDGGLARKIEGAASGGRARGER